MIKWPMHAKNDTLNDHLERLNKVLVYIQSNIDNSMNLKALSAVARFSPFHFHRIFRAYIGETVYDHVRRLRLERAAQKLYDSRQSVTEIALSVGYETPAAFTREFRKQFGKNPTEFRKMKRQNLPASLNLIKNRTQKKRKSPASPELRLVREQQVLFVRKNGSYARAASAAWPSLMRYAYSRRLMKKDTKFIGISHDNPEITPEEKIRYDACITFSGNAEPDGEVGIQTIAGGRYAVFLHSGPYSNFDRTYDSIMSEWYPKSGEKLRDAPCFEEYLNRNPGRTKPENLMTEIYVPIE